MIIQHEHQKNVMRHVFGDQADDVTAWINEHLTSPRLGDGRRSIARRGP